MTQATNHVKSTEALLHFLNGNRGALVPEYTVKTSPDDPETRHVITYPKLGLVIDMLTAGAPKTICGCLVFATVDTPQRLIPPNAVELTLTQQVIEPDAEVHALLQALSKTNCLKLSPLMFKHRQDIDVTNFMALHDLRGKTLSESFHIPSNHEDTLHVDLTLNLIMEIAPCVEVLFYNGGLTYDCSRAYDKDKDVNELIKIYEATRMDTVIVSQTD
jgi:hypothetical protein